MSSPINAQINGTFSTDAVPSKVYISLPPGYTQIKIFNETDIAGVGAGINAAEGKSTFPANYSITYTGAPLVPAIINNHGFTFIADSGNQTPGPAVAVTAITAATPAVVSSASTAAVGDIVRIINPTAMLQIGGWDFTVTATNPGVTQTLGYLPAGAAQLNFLAAATGGSIRVIPFNPRFYPVTRRITYITAAASAVITMSVAHQFTVGQLVRISVPTAYGMSQMDGQLATITAVTAGTITVNVDSSAFTAFTFPTSAAAALGTLVPEVVPVGEAATAPYQNLLNDAMNNVSFTGVAIDPAILVASKSYSWVAFKGTSI